jgi:hypothetical protein
MVPVSLKKFSVFSAAAGVSKQRAAVSEQKPVSFSFVASSILQNNKEKRIYVSTQAATGSFARATAPLTVTSAHCTRSTKCRRGSSTETRWQVASPPGFVPPPPASVAEIDAFSGARLDLRARAAGLDGPCGPWDEAATMSRLATGIHRLRGRSPWEVLWSALASCGLVLFTQLAVAMVPRLFPSLSLLAMLPIAGRWSLSPARSSLGRNVLARRL